MYSADIPVWRRGLIDNRVCNLYPRRSTH